MKFTVKEHNFKIEDVQEGSIFKWDNEFYMIIQNSNQVGWRTLFLNDLTLSSESYDTLYEVVESYDIERIYESELTITA